MAFRGRGRGRGGFRGGFGGGGGFGYAKEEPFILFPATTLPDKKVSDREETKVYFRLNSMLQHFWKDCSPYYIKEKGSDQKGKKKERTPKKSENTDIERYSDRKEKAESMKHIVPDDLFQIIKATPDNFPRELLEGKVQRVHKKVRWNLDAGLNLDLWEKREKKQEEREEKDGDKKKGENEDDENEDEDEEEEEEESSDEGGYGENKDFDDDDDGIDDDDGGDDEPFY